VDPLARRATLHGCLDARTADPLLRPPVAVAIDEVVLARRRQLGRLGDALKRLSLVRRHCSGPVVAPAVEVDSVETHDSGRRWGEAGVATTGVDARDLGAAARIQDSPRGRVVDG